MSRPVITLKTLVSQSREHGEIVLPKDALITPAAADWLQDCKQPVRRVDAAPEPIEPDPTVYIVGDAQHATIQTLLPMLERQYNNLEFLPCQGHLAGCLAAVKEMCTGLAECSERRGIVLVSSGAIVSCVANRHPKVRAAIITKPLALAELQRTLGMNLLIFERQHMSLRQIHATINAFLTGKARTDPIVKAALADWLPGSVASSNNPQHPDSNMPGA